VGECPQCGRKAEELHYSHAVGDVSCKACYCRAAPPISKQARRWRPPKPPRPPKPTRFDAFYTRVWARLEQLTDSPLFPLCDGTRRVACYCPRCLDGVMVVRFLDAEKPLIAISSSAGQGCLLGCTEREIAEVLFA
jgi:hypothetical protein